jgi:hypothetical protein
MEKDRESKQLRDKLTRSTKLFLPPIEKQYAYAIRCSEAIKAGLSTPKDKTE